MFESDDKADLALLIRAIAQIEGIGRFATPRRTRWNQRSLIEAHAMCRNWLRFCIYRCNRFGSYFDRDENAITLHSSTKANRKLREAKPDITISSDFIVGFPGETDGLRCDHELINDIGFDQSFSFIYSKRPNTGFHLRTTTPTKSNSSPKSTAKPITNNARNISKPDRHHQRFWLKVTSKKHEGELTSEPKHAFIPTSLATRASSASLSMC